MAESFLLDDADARLKKKTQKRRLTVISDLISRDALMEEYMEYLDSIPIVNNGLCNMGRRDATITCIEKLRNAESKCGEWLKSENETVSGVCSCCGWMSHFYEDDVAGMPFCPNCGAKMKQTVSLIVKGVDMPKNCGECFVGNRTICHDGCPLVKISTPHGRLVDADAIEEKCGDWFVTKLDADGYCGNVREFLSEQPTVIEAEGNYDSDRR